MRLRRSWARWEFCNSMDEGNKRHTPVLLRETVEGLALAPDATVIDATLGSGGHFSAILVKLGLHGTVLGVDADPIAVARVAQEIAQKDTQYARVLFATGNFRNISEIAKTQGLAKADAIIADLGWRMEQFSADVEAGGDKGFSFTEGGPLQMTFGDPASYSFTAADILNIWREEDIATILKGYGEERYTRKIAHAIVVRRESKKIETAAELAGIVEQAIPSRYRRGRIHPPTKTFQALRIAVNDELDALREFIMASCALLSPCGRLAIITFHSLEDRIVKQTLRSLEEAGTMRRITKKPITSTAEETKTNPRARSAKLRIAEKI